MAYNRAIQYRAPLNLEPRPPKRCPPHRVFQKEHCPHCHFDGVPIMLEVCRILETMIVKCYNNKKVEYLKGE